MVELERLRDQAAEIGDAATSGGEKLEIAYCGLCCNECVNYKGEIADLARDLRKKLREEKFDLMASGMSKYSKEFGGYETFYETLGAMVRLRCSRRCREGGGHPGCRIKKCCVKKDYQGCWECDEAEACEKHGFLKPVHGEGNVDNLRRIRKNGLEAFMAPGGR